MSADLTAIVGSLRRAEVPWMFRRPIISAFAGLLLLAVGGSRAAAVEGPQLKDVPADFGLDRRAESRRTVFKDLPLLQRRGYFLRGDEGTASILLTEFEGEISESQLEDMVEERAEQWARSGSVFSEVEDVEVDHRGAWLWYERGQRSRRVVAVIPYPEDGKIWTVDFYTSVQRLQDDESMFRHVTSFALDPVAEERAPVLLGFFLFFAVVGVVIWVLRSRRQYRKVTRL